MSLLDKLRKPFVVGAVGLGLAGALALGGCATTHETFFQENKNPSHWDQIDWNSVEKYVKKDSEANSIRAIEVMPYGDFSAYAIYSIDSKKNITKIADGYSLLWSPSKEFLAFRIFRPDEEWKGWFKEDLFIVDKKGNLKLLLEETEDIQFDSGEWSPDGKHIALRYWDSSKEDNSTDIAVVDLEGKLEFIANKHLKDYKVEAYPDWYPNGLYVDEFHPDWSPDGQYLLFVSEDEPVYGHYFYVSDLKGNSRKLTDLNVNYLGGIEWSPSSENIAFVSDVNGNDDIFVTDLDGNCRQLTHGEFDEKYLLWSPDGKKISYCSLENGPFNENIRVINIDGSGERKLTDSKDYETYPFRGRKWLSNETLTFVTFPDDRQYIVDLEGNVELYPLK